MKQVSRGIAAGGGKGVQGAGVARQGAQPDPLTWPPWPHLSPGTPVSVSKQVQKAELGCHASDSQGETAAWVLPGAPTALLLLGISGGIPDLR